VGALTPPLAQVDDSEAGRNAVLQPRDHGPFARPVRAQQGDHRSRSTQAEGPALGQRGREVFRRCPGPAGTGRHAGSAGQLGIDLQPAAAIEGQVKAMTWTARCIEPVKTLLAQRAFGVAQLQGIDQDVHLRTGGVEVDLFRAFAEGVANAPVIHRLKGGGEKIATPTLPRDRGREEVGRRLRPTGRSGWLKPQHRQRPRRRSGASPGCRAGPGRPAARRGLPSCWRRRERSRRPARLPWC